MIKKIGISILGVIYTYTVQNSNALKILLFLWGFDFITGFLKAIMQKNFQSNVVWEGVIKKIAILCVVVLATVLDVMLNNSAPIIQKIVIYAYIFMEIKSNYGNLKQCNIKIPETLTAEINKIESQDQKGG